jgi:hypothetical protein
MFGKNGASAKNCIWSVTLTQRSKQKQFVGNPENRCQDKMRGRLFHVARSMDSSSSAFPPAVLDLACNS